jgi:hypothetical protein
MILFKSLNRNILKKVLKMHLGAYKLGAYYRLISLEAKGLDIMRPWLDV